MKKLFVVITVLIFSTGLCFAQEGGAPGLPPPEKFDLEISVGFPIHWTNAEHDQDFYPFYTPMAQEHLNLDKTVTADTAIGVSLLFNFGRKAGFTMDWDFFYGARIAGFSNPFSDYNSMFGMNFLLGPVFYIYNGTFLRIPLAIGAHAYYFSDELWMPYLDPNTPGPEGGYWIKRKEVQVGPGISLGVQFHFNRNVFIFSRTNVSMDIFRWHQVKWLVDEDPLNPTSPRTLVDETKTHTELSVSWGIKPTLGLGIKF